MVVALMVRDLSSVSVLLCYIFVTPLSPVVYFPVQNITLNPLATSEVCLSVVMIGLVLILQPYKKNCPQHY